MGGRPGPVGMAGDQPARAAVAVASPEGAGGREREAEVGGDGGQGLAAQVAFDEALAGRERDGSWHGGPLGRGAGGHGEMIPMIARANDEGV